MAIKTSLRIIARRISDAVRRAASNQGLLPGDYALAGTYDEKTDRISLRLGTDRPIDERRWYADTIMEIRRSFPENPQITIHIGLVIRGVQSLEEIYWDLTDSEDEQDLTELLNRA
jgi:hypothetical protein